MRVAPPVRELVGAGFGESSKLAETALSRSSADLAFTEAALSHPSLDSRFIAATAAYDAAPVPAHGLAGLGSARPGPPSPAGRPVLGAPSLLALRP